MRGVVRFLLSVSAGFLVLGGAGWGLWLLATVATAGKFTGVSIFDVNAHGHTQLMGFFVLGVMGLAYSWKQARRAGSVDRAVLAAALVLIGVIVSTVAIAMRMQSGAVLVRLVGGALELLGVCVFLIDLVPFVRANAAGPASAFVIAGLAVIPLQLAMGVAHDVRLASAADRNAVINLVSMWQAPLRDVQVHGMLLMLAVGAGLGCFPHWKRRPKRARAGFVVLLLAILLEAGLFVLYRISMRHWMAALLMIPWLMLPIGFWLATGWRWKIRPSDSDNPQEPLTDAQTSSIDSAGLPDGPSARLSADAAARTRAAIASAGQVLPWAIIWTGVSMGMLLAMPLYLRWAQVPFSHAFYGASQHAFTVGGIASAMMAAIIGFAGGRVGWWFWLWNLGCLLHVSLEGLSDAIPMLVGWAWVAGVVELLAGTIWAALVLRRLWGGDNRGVAGGTAGQIKEA